MKSHRTTLTACPHCLKKVDAASALDDGRPPDAGDASICWHCGKIGIYEADQTIRIPTEDERRALSLAPDVIEAQLFLAAGKVRKPRPPKPPK